jgi:hypothetical protein
MKTRAVEWLAVALLCLAGHPAAAADADSSLAGTWSLDDRSSDDPVSEIGGKHGNGLGRQIIRSVNVFGFPVGAVMPSEGQEKEDPLTPQQVVGALSYVFEATYKLRITQNQATTEIRYGNSPTMSYRAPATFQNDGWTSKVEWHNGALTIEHDRPSDGAHVSERYWVVAKADELHWTAQFKRAKTGTIDVKRVYYRAPTDQDTKLPLTAGLTP